MVVFDSMRIAVHGKRYSVLTIKMCSRWIRRHPAMVGFLCFLVFLYRSFPFCFSVLVSASPVLFCTAALLGTLLSFGEPRFPEIEEAVVTNEDDDDDVMFEKHEMESVKGSSSNGDVVNVDEKAREIQFAEQVEKVFTELEMKMRKREEGEKKAAKVDDNDDGVGSKYSSVRGSRDGGGSGGLESDGDGIKSTRGFRDARDGGSSNGGGLDSDGDGIKSMRDFLAARMGDRDECGGNEEEEDSGSDRAESSSPDASMADIMPILDELHPLLDEEASQQQGGLVSHYGSASEGSHHNLCSSDDDGDDDDSEEDEGKLEDDEEGESEEAQTGKEDESKSAIKWTEDDQKNLMDLGTSELERNQRLESLIARRRARRSSRSLIEKEKNLIDFDGDLHFNVSHISTSRGNPFDYDDAPGSAPSIMFLRRNPFDLPYDSGEEKPDLKGDSSDQEFPTIQHREPMPVFRRHDSFNVGPSYLGRQERASDLRWKPYFMPERFANEGTTSFSVFHRQLSEISESKMSSIPDSESAEEEKKHGHHQAGSLELIANVDTSSVLVEHGSLSSEGIDGLDAESVHHEEADVISNNHETDSCLSPSGSIVVPVHINTREILLRMEPGEEEYSSLSSLSSPDEKASTNGHKVSLTNHENEVSTHTQLHVDHLVSSDAVDNLVNDPDSRFNGDQNGAPSVLTDTSDHHEEPVFDSSPPSLDKFLSFKSISSDVQAELSEFASLSALPQSVLAQHFSGAHMNKQDEEMKVVTSHSPSSDQQVQWSEKSMVGPSFNNHEKTEPMVQNAEHVSKVSTRSASPTEAFWSPESRESFNFEEDVTKEIDEGILSELDTVGDFRVKEVSGEQTESGSQHLVKQTSSDTAESNGDGINTRELPVLEVRTAEDIDLAFKQLHEGAEVDEVILPSRIKQQSLEEDRFRSPDAQPSTPLQVIEARFPEDIHAALMQRAPKGSEKDIAEPSKEKGISMKELPVLEVRTAEDIDLAFKQLHEGAELEEIILPSMIKQQEEDRFGSPDAQPSTPLQVIEARFPEDIHLALMQRAGPSDSTVVQRTDEVISGKDLPVLEVRTAEDIDLAFKQLHEGVELREIILPSKMKHQLPEDEFRSPEVPPSTPLQGVEARFIEDIHVSVIQQASKRSGKDVSEPSGNELPFLEVKTAEDIDLAFKQLHEGAEPDEVILPSTIDQLSTEDEFGSPSEQPTTPMPVLQVRTAEDIDLAFKQLRGGAKFEEVILPSTIKQKTRDEDEFRSPSEQPSTPMQVLQVRTAEDIYLAFKQLHEGVKLEEVILPSTIEQQSREEDEFRSPSEQPSTPMPVLQVRTAEDIDLAFKQLRGGAKFEEVILPNMIKQKSHDEDEFRSPSEQPSTPMPVLQVRTVEDIDLAFKQIRGGAKFEEVILPSMIKQKSRDEDEFRSPSEQPSTPMPVLQVRTAEDIDLAFKQLLGGAKFEDVILPNMIKQKSHDEDEFRSPSEQPSTPMPVLQVRTVDDIDLAFKQLRGGAKFEEVILPSMIKQKSCDEDEFRNPSEQPSTPMQVLQVRTVEDIDLAFKQLRGGAKFEEVILPSMIKQKSRDEDEFQSPSEQPSTPMPVLQVRTVEDIDLAFKQLRGGAKFEEVILPSMIKHKSRDEDEFRSPSEQPSTPMQVLQVRTVEDIDLAFKQLRGGAKFEEVILPSMIKQKSRDEDEFRSPSEQPSTPMQVLQVRTVEDIYVAFKQLHEGAKLEEVILPSTIKQQSCEEGEFRSPSEQPSTPLQVVEAKHIDDIHVAVRELASKGGNQSIPEPSDSQKKISGKELPVLEVRTAEDIDLAFKQLHEGAELEEVILPSTIKQKSLEEDEFRSPSEQPSTPLQVVEAKHIDDIQVAVRELASKTKAKDKTQASGNELPFLEVKTAEDIDLAFKQLHEGAEVNEVILPSHIKQRSLAEEDEFGSPTELPSTPLQVVEARFVDDIHAAVLQQKRQADTDSRNTKEMLPVLEVSTAEDIDLAFKQLHEGAEVNEVIVPSHIKQRSLVEEDFRSPDEHPSTPLQVVEARFVDDIHAAVLQQTRQADTDSSNTKEMLPVLEVSTAEDIDLAFKQLHEGAEVNEVIVPSHIKQRSLVEEDFRSPDEQPSTPLQVVEARFVDDIHAAVMQQTRQADTDSSNTKEMLPVLEVSTAEDIDLAFKQLHEGAEVNEVIVPSHIKQRSLVDEDFRSPDEQPSTPLQVVEARFVEDINTAVMQLGSKGNAEELH
ncbi:hypothetical protein LINPERPRIM_LOCUS14260 [Linum perenne]